MWMLYRSMSVAIGLTVGSLASAQAPLPPMGMVLIAISPRAAVQAGAEWYWSPTTDETKLVGPFQSGDVTWVNTDKIRITPRQLAGPCVAPAAVDIEVKTGEMGYVLLAYRGADCG